MDSVYLSYFIYLSIYLTDTVIDLDAQYSSFVPLYSSLNDLEKKSCKQKHVKKCSVYRKLRLLLDISKVPWMLIIFFLSLFRPLLTQYTRSRHFQTDVAYNKVQNSDNHQINVIKRKKKMSKESFFVSILASGYTVIDELCRSFQTICREFSGRQCQRVRRVTKTNILYIWQNYIDEKAANIKWPTSIYIIGESPKRLSTKILKYNIWKEETKKFQFKISVS